MASSDSRRGVGLLCAAAILSAGSGCATRIPKGALAMRPQALEHRQRSTRLFETMDETQILAAVAGLLQDLGFNIDESETKLGLIVASKERSAVEAGQVAAKIAYAVVFRGNLPIDAEQKMRASVVTRPEGHRLAVRVTFQRIVWNDRGQVSKLELLDDVPMYQEFFEKLSKSVFLEAHEL
jgi:hypothetical protein